MVAGCGAKTVKTLVIFFNLLAFLAGAVLLAGSVAAYLSDPARQWLIDDFKELQALKSLRVALIFGMVLGSVVIVLGFIGCCGALTENHCLLVLFIILMSVLMIAQCALGGLIFFFKNKLQEPIEEIFKNIAASAYHNPNGDACKFLQDLSKDFCCESSDGLQNSRSNFPMTMYDNAEYSRSINLRGNRNIGSCILDCQNTIGKDCADETLKAFDRMGVIGGAVIFGIAALELAAILFACCLCCSFDSGSKRAYL